MKENEKSRQRGALMRQMRQLATAKVNDAVKLAYLTEEQMALIDKLDLMALTEFKRSGSGAVEVKFTDRMKAVERLIAMLEDSDDDRAEAIARLLGGGESQ